MEYLYFFSFGNENQKFPKVLFTLKLYSVNPLIFYKRTFSLLARDVCYIIQILNLTYC